MATLKEHQQAMVDLLASGSGIPASASRLAHAMHDVLKFMTTEQLVEHADWRCQDDATTPGLSDKALAGDLEACRPKQDIKESLLRSREQRIKGLENTVKQLRASNAKLRAELDHSRTLFESGFKRCVQTELLPEQAGCRKDDTQVCEHLWQQHLGDSDFRECIRCGVVEDLFR